MSNALQRLIDLLPTAAEFVGTITSVDHPNYKVLVVGGSGLNLVTSSTRYNLGATVFVSDGEIKRLAPLGEVIQIEVQFFKKCMASKRVLFYCQKLGVVCE